MKIESIETIPIRVPLPFTYKGSYYKMRNRSTIITRIRTSDGILGEAYNADEDEPLSAEAERLAPSYRSPPADVRAVSVHRRDNDATGVVNHSACGPTSSSLPNMMRSTACSKRAPGPMIAGDLPPSSSVTGVRLAAAARIT